MNGFQLIGVLMAISCGWIAGGMAALWLGDQVGCFPPFTLCVYLALTGCAMVYFGGAA